MVDDWYGAGKNTEGTDYSNLTNTLEAALSVDDVLDTVSQTSFANIAEDTFKSLLSSVDDGIMSIYDKVTINAYLMQKAMADGVILSDLQVVADASFIDEYGRLIYPDGDGFVLDSYGNSVKEEIIPQIYNIIDRYGSNTGRFASPVIDGKSFGYSERSLPFIENPASYHNYQIIRDFSELQNTIQNCTDKNLQQQIYEFMENENLGVGDLKVYEGYAAQAYDQTGGAKQWKLPLAIDFLEHLGFIKKYFDLRS